MAASLFSLCLCFFVWTAQITPIRRNFTLDCFWFLITLLSFRFSKLIKDINRYLDGPSPLQTNHYEKALTELNRILGSKVCIQRGNLNKTLGIFQYTTHTCTFSVYYTYIFSILYVHFSVYCRHFFCISFALV